MTTRALILLTVLLALGCGGGGFHGPTVGESSAGGGGGGGGGGGNGGGDGGSTAKPLPTPIPAVPLVEDRSVYDQDALEILDLHVRILPGGATLAEVNSDDDPYNHLDIEALCEISEPGWVFADGNTTTSAVLRMRGNTSRLANQKSYRIRIDDKDNRWRNHRILQLNKHPFDLTRMRQKLSFDLMKSLEHMTSLRTQFVRLWIDGASFGLYTLVERCNADYLKAHGLDKGGHLYSPDFFEQQRYPDHLRNVDDPEYDVEKFEEVLDIRGREDDHSKLLNMLDVLNDHTNDINDVVRDYFERENFLTWWATNILLENIDTSSQNYFLYSPRTTTGWYFQPWDYDGAWDFYGQPIQVVTRSTRRRTEGIANWWNCTLQRRFVTDPQNLADLIAKVEELKDEFYTPARIQTLLDSYRSLILHELTSAPDFFEIDTVANDPAERIAEIQGEIDRLPTIPQASYERLMSSLERPMPIFLGEPRVEGGRIHFNWGESYDLQGDGLIYDFLVADDYHFLPGDIVFQELGLTRTTADIAMLPKGTYWFRVIIRDTKDPANHWQYPFDEIREESRFFEGMKEFTVD